MDKEKEKKYLGLRIGGVPVCFDDWIDQWPTLEWGLDPNLRVIHGYEDADNGWWWTQQRRTEMAADTFCLEYWGA